MDQTELRSIITLFKDSYYVSELYVSDDNVACIQKSKVRLVFLRDEIDRIKSLIDLQCYEGLKNKVNDLSEVYDEIEHLIENKDYKFLHVFVVFVSTTRLRIAKMLEEFCE